MMSQIKAGTWVVIVLASLSVIALTMAVTTCSRERNADTRAAISNSQAGAAIQSGTDAASTVGNRAAGDAATDRTVQEATDAIRNAQGADAPVDNHVRDAGLRSLCELPAYSDYAGCMQRPHP